MRRPYDYTVIVQCLDVPIIDDVVQCTVQQYAAAVKNMETTSAVVVDMVMVGRLHTHLPGFLAIELVNAC